MTLTPRRRLRSTIFREARGYAARAVNWKLFLFGWLGSTLPIGGMVLLLARSNESKVEFRRLAEGRAEGTIVRMVREPGGRLRLSPIITFTTLSGRTTEFKSIYYDTQPPYQYAVGQRVPVMYVPAEPQRAEIDDPRMRQPDGEIFRTGAMIWTGAMTVLWTLLAALIKPKRARPLQASE